MKYFLRKSDGAVYGPVQVEALRQWAVEGRIAPEDFISMDRESWQRAPDLPALQMDWMIELPDGSLYGPLHLLATLDLAKDGTASLEARVTHKDTGEQSTLIEAFQAAATVGRPAAAADAGGSAAVEPPPHRQEWKELVARRDFFEKESQKWKKMYDDEHANALRREAALNERIEELRKSELNARTRLEQMDRKVSQIEKSYKLLQKAMEAEVGDAKSAQLLALTESYQNLAQAYDNLMKELTAKSEEVQSLLDSRRLVEKKAEEQTKSMEEVVRRERQEADNARTRMADFEESHRQLAKSYRELNDRFIRMRDQQPAPAPKPSGAAPVRGTQGVSHIRLNR